MGKIGIKDLKTLRRVPDPWGQVRIIFLATRNLPIAAYILWANINSTERKILNI
jgi:hypothetical protein